MLKAINQIKTRLRKQTQFIQSPQVNLINKIILTRSLIETYAVYNFLKAKDSLRRIELFQCFGDFEWYSHQIYFSEPKADRIQKFRRFLIQTKARYPFGYQKYGRLIKRRLCKRLRGLIKAQPHHQDKWQRQLDLINSNQPDKKAQQITLLAKYLCNHLITKLPFPYRIVFGKSITYFVLKYSHVNKNVYWLLADLSHGTLIENHLNSESLLKIIRKILKIINSNLD